MEVVALALDQDACEVALARLTDDARFEVGERGEGGARCGVVVATGIAVAIAVAAQHLPAACLADLDLVGPPVGEGRAGRQHAPTTIAEALLEEVAQPAAEMVGGGV